MLKYALRRVLVAIPTILLVTVVVFALLHMVPGDPVELMLTEFFGEPPTIEEIERERVRLGLDGPIPHQYFRWLIRVLQLDLGVSMRTGERVLSEIARAFPVTMELAIASVIVALLIAFPAGIISAVRQNSLADYSSRLGALLGLSIPNFWLGVLLILVFSLRLGLLPVFGRGEIQHLILPAITLGTGMAALSSRLLRSSMLEVLKEDYIRTARAKGLREHIVVCKHALKCALIPVVTIVGLQIGFALGGSAIVETIFAFPGIGRLMVESIFARDFVMVQGLTLVFALVIIIANLIVDISYAYLDPRIKYD
jgi:peptide/nickel transport system permease protein